MSTFYPENDYRSYLEHHGIKGQRWGKKNGPPYPLADAVHNRIVKHKEKKAAKKRQQILHDPKKLYKHATEFSTEELNTALEKIDAMNRVKSRIPGQSEKELEKKIKKLAPNASELEKNSDKFTTEELRKANERVGIKHQIYDKKMSELDRPRKFLQVGSNLLGTIADAVGNAKRIGDLTTPKYDTEGFTKEERRFMNMYKKYKDDPEMLKTLGVGVDRFADRLNKVLGKDADQFINTYKEGLNNGDINWEDIPEGIREILKDKKGFKQYS